MLPSQQIASSEPGAPACRFAIPVRGYHAGHICTVRAPAGGVSKTFPIAQADLIGA